MCLLTSFFGALVKIWSCGIHNDVGEEKYAMLRAGETVEHSEKEKKKNFMSLHI